MTTSGPTPHACDREPALARRAGTKGLTRIPPPRRAPVRNQLRRRPAEARFECSKHDSVYRLDGVYLGGRATRNMDRFPVKRQGNSVVVKVATMIQSDMNKAEWEAAVIAV